MLKKPPLLVAFFYKHYIMKRYLIILMQFLCLSIFSQNTVGVISSSLEAYNGYTLFYPYFSSSTYLINNCGQIVHQWQSAYTPAASCYLLENGNLLRTGKIPNSSITFGGVGGKIELFDWDGNLLWEYTYSTSEYTQHHDIFPMPNGNILMLAVSTINSVDAIEMGRDPSAILEGKIYNEQIVELQPVGTNQANIVWEWNIQDHLIQDFDVSKNNYGIIKDHPELLDINFLNNNPGNANWLHANSIHYNAILDQIVLSSRLLSEIYIIDHSTTTSEAASHSGGLYGKGGDFLYRWGNPISHDFGNEADCNLFDQHYPHWIPDGLNDAGKLMIFNNAVTPRSSAVDIITPTTTAPGVYTFDPILGFGPSVSDWTYEAPNPTDFFSSILSSAQRLPNGNTLICDGDSGYLFELDQSNNIVWEYVNPDDVNGILSQGEIPVANFLFRAKKYAPDFAAFTGRDLTSGNQIELNPNSDACTTLGITDLAFSDIKIFPNPSSNVFNINTTLSINKIELYDSLGQLVREQENTTRIEAHHLKSGMYFLKIYSENAYVYKKIIKN